MKTVKEICLGVALAGVVVGAGTTVACAVASAETGPDGGNSATATRSVGPSKSSSARQAARVRPAASASVANAASVSSSRSVLSGAASRATAKATRNDGGAGSSAAALAPFSTAPSAAVTALSAVPVLPAPASARSVAAPAAAVAPSAVAAGPTHVLLIGTDGTNLSKVLANSANTGFFNLMNQSVTGATSLVGHTTISGPSWTTILTGVWDTKSGVINNIFDPAPYDKWPTVFNQLEAYNPGIRTAVVADWQYINDIAAAGGKPADVNTFVGFTDSWAATDAQVVAKTIDLINTTSPTDSSFIFSYQVQVDEQGHSYGGGSPEYAEAVTNVSNNIAQIMAAVSQWEATTGEDWTVIVTTDHGHQQSVGFGHGFQSPNETSSFVIFDQAGSTDNGLQNLAYSTVDITPTIVSLFGAPSRSDFDGVPLTTLATSVVDPTNLNQALTDAINTFGYPNIGTDVTLAVRTIAGSVPYFLNIAVTSITDSLNAIAAQNTFLVSPIAGVAAVIFGLLGGAIVNATNGLAHIIGYLTGAGTIAPSDPPLSSVPSTEALLALAV